MKIRAIQKNCLSKFLNFIQCLTLERLIVSVCLATRYSVSRKSTHEYPPPNPLTRRQAEILDVIENRGITRLVHFTDYRNLELIKEYGILSVAEMDRLGVTYHPNDSQRLDRRRNRISCSITVHNRYLLKEFQTRNARKWIRIYIDPKVCYRKNCKFFYTNAANSIFQIPNINTDLKSPMAFNRMFENPIEVPTSSGSRSIQRYGKPRNEPTDVQAEVMIKKRIPKEFLLGYDELYVDA